jgi:hypothetical protein
MQTLIISSDSFYLPPIQLGRSYQAYSQSKDVDILGLCHLLYCHTLLMLPILGLCFAIFSLYFIAVIYTLEANQESETKGPSIVGAAKMIKTDRNYAWPARNGRGRVYYGIQRTRSMEMSLGRLFPERGHIWR